MDCSKKILIVDDDTNIRLYLRRAFEKSGYCVEEAINGYDAFEMMKKEPPDFAIIDYIMPKVDGLQLAEMMKNDARTNSIPFMVVSSWDKEELIDKAFRVGAIYYMRKADLRDSDVTAFVNSLSMIDKGKE